MDLPQHNKLETYNRVKSLESPLIPRLLALSYCLLLLLAAGASISFFMPMLNIPYALLLILMAAALCIALYWLGNRFTQHCRFCGGRIELVKRPFLLSAKYLAMKGYKEDGYFYTRCRWGNKPFRQRWAKLSNLSRACHHCRLMEERYTTLYEQPSALELVKIQAKTGN